MSSARAYAATNRRLPCDARGCRFRRNFTSRFCSRHRTKLRLYGSPEGRYIRKLEYGGYVKIVRQFFARHANHVALQAAEDAVRAILTPAREQPHGRHLRLSPTYQLWRELSRLQSARVEPREALETVVAVWLLSYHQPRVLPDSERLTYALANAVLRLAPLDAVKGWDHIAGKPWSVSRTPGALAVGLLGRRLRDALVPFLVNVVQSLEADHDTQQKHLRASFTASTTNIREE